MDTTQPEIIERVRTMARGGSRPSNMLREIVAAVAPEQADQQLLVRYFTEAFRFTEGQAYTIFGWLPDGTGQLSDATLDHLLSRRIEQSRAEWDRPVRTEGAA